MRTRGSNAVFRTYLAALATLSQPLRLGARAADPRPDPIVPLSTTNVALAVAPLTLPGISDACYDVRVTATETVWSRGTPGEPAAGQTDPTARCAHQFGCGTGGDVTYTVPCDASGDARTS